MCVFYGHQEESEGGGGLLAELKLVSLINQGLVCEIAQFDGVKLQIVKLFYCTMCALIVRPMHRDQLPFQFLSCSLKNICSGQGLHRLVYRISGVFLPHTGYSATGYPAGYSIKICTLH